MNVSGKYEADKWLGDSAVAITREVGSGRPEHSRAMAGLGGQILPPKQKQKTNFKNLFESEKISKWITKN